MDVFRLSLKRVLLIPGEQLLISKLSPSYEILRDFLHYNFFLSLLTDFGAYLLSKMGALMTQSFGSGGEHRGDVVGRKGSSEQVRPYQPVCSVTGRQVGRRAGTVERACLASAGHLRAQHW